MTLDFKESRNTLLSYPWWWKAARLLDFLLMPFMWVFSGFAQWPPQSTHAWHLITLSFQVNPKLTATITGTDESLISRGGGGLFHLPLFGGWRDFVVLSVDSNLRPWFIGWMVGDNRVEVQRLPINSDNVKLLIGPVGSQTTFIAFSLEGQQLPLVSTATGRVGDGSFSKIPFY